MIIVVAGIKRSASTAQFNMIRLSLLEAGETVHTFGSQYEIKEGWNIIKVHPFSQKLYDMADFVFTTDRPDKDIEKSMDRFSKKPWNLPVMREWLRKWKRKSVHMEFQDICNDPDLCIQVIIDVLGLNVNRFKVYRKFEKIKPPKTGYDPKTFLFANHRNV